MQQSETAKNPDVWVEMSYVVMAVHGLIRFADGLRLPAEFDPEARRKPLLDVPTENPSAAKTLDEVARFYALETAPAVFRAIGIRPQYLRVTWDFIKKTFQPDLLTVEQKNLIAYAVAAASGSDYGIDFFAREAKRSGVSEGTLFETLCIVQRFAGLTKFATALNLEPDRFPQF